MKRSQAGDLHRLEIPACPVEVLAAVAHAAGTGVTVENHVPVPTADTWFESTMSIAPDGPAVRRRIRNLAFDIALDNREFLDLVPFWDTHGVYAVFTERGPIAFQASRLKPPARYAALRNFGFVLEFSLGGPTTDGWSEIVTPRSDLADLAESALEAAGPR